MNYKINIEEKSIIKKFQSMRIPAIFKKDNTDRILFVEDVDSFICDSLIRGKGISDSLYNEIMIDYDRFISNTDVNSFDEYAVEYFNICVQIVEIMKKYCLRKN